MGGVGGGGVGGGWKEKTTKGRQTVASVPSPLSLVSITTVSQQMVGRMGMKGGKKKGEKAPCCHSFRFSLPHSTKGGTPVTRYSGKLRRKVHFLPNFPTPKNPGIENSKPPKIEVLQSGPVT